MSNWQNVKRRLKKAEHERKELEKSLGAIRTVVFMPNVTLKDIQEALLEEEYLRALRVEPLF